VRQAPEVRIALTVVVGVLLSGAMPGKSFAQAVARDHVTAELVSELDAIVPGATWLVALRLVSEPGWHTYWKNPGDAGSATNLRWTLPPGFRAGPILWPTPDRLAEPPLAAYGYQGEVLLLAEIEAPQALPARRPAGDAGRARRLGGVPGDLPAGRPVTIPLTQPYRCTVKY
jgi:DsbC/DsbD-like thiol-disulfide interchange protein